MMIVFWIMIGMVLALALALMFGIECFARFTTKYVKRKLKERHMEEQAKMEGGI